MDMGRRMGKLLEHEVMRELCVSNRNVFMKYIYSEMKGNYIHIQRATLNNFPVALMQKRITWSCSLQCVHLPCQLHTTSKATDNTCKFKLHIYLYTNTRLRVYVKPRLVQTATHTSNSWWIYDYIFLNAFFFTFLVLPIPHQLHC